MIKYRQININDRQELMDLIYTICNNLERKEFFIPYNKQELEDLFNKNKVITYGAYDEEKLVGTAQIFYDKSYTEEIKEILNMNNKKIAEFGGYLVLEEHRNKGIMKNLVDILIAALKKMNYEYAVITSHPENIASIKVTEHTGAELVKTTYFGKYLRNIYVLKI